MAKMKGVPVATKRADSGSTALSLSGAERMHNTPRPKPRGLSRFAGSKRSGGGRIRGAASEPNTILSGVVDRT
jgi:hypothetical protein